MAYNTKPWRVLLENEHLRVHGQQGTCFSGRFTMHTNLAGRHVMVTGGSRGIGSAIVRAFLGEGANVSYCSRHATGREFADLCVESDATQAPVAVGSNVDVADHKALKQWVDNATARFGRLDHVVANASPIIHDPDIDSWRTSFEADIVGLIALIQAATPHLQRNPANDCHAASQGSPSPSDDSVAPPTNSSSAVQTTTKSVTIISSLVGWERLDPVVGSPYTTLKRSQATLARDYVRRLSPLGIRINVVVPGMIRVDSIPIPEYAMPQYLKLIPLGRVGMPEDVANACVFLGSELSSYVTGAVVFIDGGLSTSL